MTQVTRVANDRAAGRRLALAGVLGIGVAFGFARYGYGLFLPALRAEFGLSLTWVGAVASASYAAYLAVLTVVGVTVGRVGPRLPVVAGGVCAAAGTGLVALAQGPGTLAVGLVLAGTSAGWAWAPYSDAVDRVVPPARRSAVLALLPTGTAFATVASGVLYLVLGGGDWRWAWGLFAVVALGVAVYNARVLPPGPGRGGARRRGTGASDPVRGVARPVRGAAGPVRAASDLGRGASDLGRGAAVPLYSTALSYGVVGSVYWAFAADTVAGAIGGGAVSAALFWTLMGAAGIAAVSTGRLIDARGLRGAHTLLLAAFAASVALLGVLPDRLGAVAVSAVVYGASFMALSGLLAVWSHRVFPERPAAGFSAVVFALGVGTVVGPLVAGGLADRAGTGAVFLGAAGVAAVTLLARPGEPGHVRGRART